MGYSDPSSLNATSLRVDHRFSDRVTLFGRYDHAPSTSARRYFSEIRDSTVKTDTATFGLTALVTPRMLDEFRANWSRQTAGLFSRMDSFYGAVPPPASALYPATYSTDDQFVFIPPGAGEVREGNQSAPVQRQWNFVDTFSMTTGKHEFKFGFDFRRLHPNSGFFNSFLVTDFSYADLQAGIADDVFQTSETNIWVKLDNYSSFAQDTWKALPRLTLTYGLRWEINTPPVSTTQGKPLYAVTGIFDSQPLGLAPAGTPLWHTRFNNFAPRIGAAWQLTPTTIVRGGFGLYYDLGIPAGVQGTTSAFPYDQATSLGPLPFNLGNPAFMPPPFSLVPGPDTLDVEAFDPHLRTPVTYEWNVTVEQALGANQRLSASYVGSHGGDLLRADLRTPNPNSNPTFLTTVNAGWSSYSALQLQFQRRMSSGLQVLASYTFAKAVDTQSTDVCECGQVNGLHSINPAVDLGPSDFDVRNSFVAAISYQLPAPNAPFIHNLLRGWTVDGIVRSSSALPFDIYDRTRPNIVPGQPFYLPDPGNPGGRILNSAAFSIPTEGQQGDLPRNYFRGFPINQTDVALSRRIHLSERTALYLRAEYFNVFNHPMFSPPDIFSPIFGQVYQTLNNGLGGLNPLYQIGGPRSAQLTLKVTL